MASTGDDLWGNGLGSSEYYPCCAGSGDTTVAIKEIYNFETMASFPAVGEEAVIYIDDSNNQIYKWSDSTSVYSLLSDKIPVASTTIFDTGKSTYTPDFSLTETFSYTLTEDSIIENPINVTTGQYGYVIITQDSVGNWSKDFKDAWIFPNGEPVVEQAANSQNVFRYFAVSSTKILVEFVSDI